VGRVWWVGGPRDLERGFILAAASSTAFLGYRSTSQGSHLRRPARGFLGSTQLMTLRRGSAAAKRAARTVTSSTIVTSSIALRRTDGVTQSVYRDQLFRRAYAGAFGGAVAKESEKHACRHHGRHCCARS